MLRRPGVSVLVALLTCVPMTYWSVELFGDVRADLRELLPEGAPSTQTMKTLEARFGSFSQLSIIVESPSRDANRRFSDDLVARMRKLKGLRSVRNKVGPEKAFFAKRWHLFVEVEDLEEVRDRIEDAIHDAKVKANPLLVELEDSGEKRSFDLSDITEKYDQRRDLILRFPNDYFESKDGQTLAVIARRRGLAFGLSASQQLVDDVNAIISDLNPAGYHAELTVGLGGDVKNVLEVHTSLIEDLIVATSIVTGGLALVVVVYFRRRRALYLVFVPLSVGTVWTFGLSHFVIGYLNSSSAFLAAIVPGNGINFGLIMLARYIEARRAKVSVEDAIDNAVRHTWRATSTAALAASMAYGSLMATDFLGFKHFGIIGGMGMILCWIATFLVMPPLILWSENRVSMDQSPELRLPLPAPGRLAALPGLAVTRRPRTFAAIGVLSALFAGAITVAYLDDPFEKDFEKLGSTKSKSDGAGYWEAKVDQIFGRYLSPQIIITDDEADVPAVLAHLQAAIDAEGDRAPISDATALSAMVPGNQDDKIEILDEIRDLLTDDVLESLDPELKKRAARHRPAAGLESFAVEDLPEPLRAEYRELDGTEGRVVLVLPNLALNLYHADEIQRVADLIRSIRLPDGRVVESSGNFVIYSDMLAAVGRDGPRATLYSFIGVLLLCLIAFRRPRRVAIVVGSLLCGVAWMGAILALTGLKINFLNFIGLPITFGIGVDYAVNIFGRGVIERAEHGPQTAVRRSIQATGGAVMLCSLTTIIGYGSLIVARNGALISFGKLAVLGEVTCLIAAMLILPAWMTVWPGPGPDEAEP